VASLSGLHLDDVIELYATAKSLKRKLHDAKDGETVTTQGIPARIEGVGGHLKLAFTVDQPLNADQRRGLAIQAENEERASEARKAEREARAREQRSAAPEHAQDEDDKVGARQATDPGHPSYPGVDHTTTGPVTNTSQTGELAKHGAVSPDQLAGKDVAGARKPGVQAPEGSGKPAAEETNKTPAQREKGLVAPVATSRK
jgi:hypothetical protein